jgi:hypothetical protein
MFGVHFLNLLPVPDLQLVVQNFFLLEAIQIKLLKKDLIV